MENELIQYFTKYSDEIRYRLIRILIVFAILFVLFTIFRIEDVTILGHQFLFIYPDPYSNIGAQVLSVLETHILPPNTQLLIIKPIDGIMADFYTCMALSIIISMPFIIYQISKFITPALKKSEITLLKSIIIPASLLFFAGVFMGLYFVAPELFRIFTAFDIGLGAATTLSISSFISFLFMYIIAFGLSFEIPIFMVYLSKFGIVRSSTWRESWRYAVIGSLFYGMIFSPGVTGFTMIVIAIPMIILYFCGVYFSKRVEKSNID